MSTEKNYNVQFLKVLQCIKEAGCCNDLVIVGGWAEYLYMAGGVLPDYLPEFMTNDTDIMVLDGNEKSGRQNLIRIAAEHGFTYDPNFDNGYSRLVGDEGFTVEFLMPQKGDGQKIIKRNDIGIIPQQLSHMWMLKNTIPVRYHNYAVNVPEPEAYYIHKIIINSQRGPKTLKDQAAIANLEKYIDREKVNDYLSQLSKKELAKYNTYMQDVATRRHDVNHIVMNGKDHYVSNKEIRDLIFQGAKFKTINDKKLLQAEMPNKTHREKPKDHDLER